NEENIIGVYNPGSLSQAMFVYSDTGNDLWLTSITLSGGVLSSTAADGGTALETVLATITGSTFDFAYEPAKAASALTQSAYIWENDDGATTDANTKLANFNT